MKKTNGMIMVFLLLMSMLAVGVGAQGTNSVVITQPTALDTLKGTAVEFNGTFTNGSGGVQTQAMNVSIYIGTGAQRICNNATVNNATGTWACKVNLNTLNDNSSLVLNITVGNQSDVGNSSTITIANDDTNPVARLNGQILDVKRQSQIPYDCSQSSDNIDGSLTYQVNLIKPDGSNASNILTTSTGTFTDGDFDLPGVYTLACTVQDNAPSTVYKGSVAIASPAAANSNQVTASINVQSGGGNPSSGFVKTQSEDKKSNEDMVIIGVVIGVIALFVFGKKGGR